jgi:predicted cupin superfamily sugar epimerase
MTNAPDAEGSTDNFDSLPSPVHHPDARLSDYARATISDLNLAPHPEGGWFRRDWQSPHTTAAAAQDAELGDHGSATGARPFASLIYFLLPAGDYSEWHKVDADEVWLWHGPGTVKLGFGGTGSAPHLERVVELGVQAGRDSEDARKATTQVTEGVSYLTAAGHAIVPAGVWQRTIPSQTDALVSCMVSPGFVFDGFSLE